MALIGLTRKEITRLEKHKLKRRKFRVEALKVSSFLSVVTISKLETIPKKLRPISRSTKMMHSVLPVNPLVILRYLQLTSKHLSCYLGKNTKGYTIATNLLLFIGTNPTIRG